MGLDVTAYRQLALVPNSEPVDEYASGFVRIDPQEDFAGREAPLTPGVYRFAEEYGFRAGSYGGYSVWREQLAALAGHNANDVWDGKVSALAPFVPLINFSDCEGTIGTEACTLLRIAFEEFQTAADAHEDDYFREKYAEWRKAVTMAADGGCLVFH